MRWIRSVPGAQGIAGSLARRSRVKVSVMVTVSGGGRRGVRDGEAYFHSNARPTKTSFDSTRTATTMPLL